MVSPYHLGEVNEGGRVDYLIWGQHMVKLIIIHAHGTSHMVHTM